MRVLFVGATGVIGRQVVPLLVEKFDIKPAARESATVAGLEVTPCDITDFAQALPLMEGVDAVVNCAIESPLRGDGKLIDAKTPDRFMAYNEGGIEVNVRGAYHLYEAAARCGVGKFVFISSMTAVLGQPKYKHVPRDAAPRPRNFYACTKLFGENLGSVYAHDAKRPMRVLALRLGQPYPSLSDFDKRWHKTSGGRSLMVAVQDVAQAMECALRADVSFGVYPILSRSDAVWADTSAADDIGYAPRFAFTAEGLKEIAAP